MSELSTSRLTRLEYERMVDAGVLGPDDPVELIDGQLRVAEPQGTPHVVAVSLAGDGLRAAFGAGWVVREEKPIALDDDSEPEPDVAVVPGKHRDHLAAHPARPVLVVEVSESSRAWDRGHKASLYARAGIADCWIVNLADRVLEVHRDPVADASAPFGWRYGSVVALGPAGSVTPVARPGTVVTVADLLP